METLEKVHGRRRAGGRHADPIVVSRDVDRPKPRGRHAAVPVQEEVAPVVVEEVPEEVTLVTLVPATVDEKPDVPTNTGPLNVVPVTGPTPLIMSRRKAKAMAAAVTTGGMLLVGGAMGMSAAPKTKTETLASQDVAPDTASQAIVAPAEAVLTQDKVDVTTEAAPPAPVVQAPVKVVEAPAPVQSQRPVAPAAPVPKPVEPVVAEPAPIVSSGKGGIIAQAAISQIGRGQDCTMLATNSLAAAGVNFHGWPWEYATLGTNVGVANAQPGDLLLYAPQNGMPAHIGVYIGNGRAIHGGWNGNQTIEWSSNVGWPAYPPYAAIRVP